MVWTCYAVKFGISTLLAAAKLGISPPIPTITLSIQHEGPLLSQALGIFTMNMSTHFGKHYLCGKCTCLSLKTSSKKKKSQTINQVCNTLAESQQPLVWNNGNRQFILPLLRREENTERTKRQSARVFVHYRFYWGGHENRVLPRIV